MDVLDLLRGCCVYVLCMCDLCFHFAEDCLLFPVVSLFCECFFVLISLSAWWLVDDCIDWQMV